MGESPILAELEIAQGGKGVRVEFTKTDGVISHTIFLVNGDEKVPALTSRINAPGQPCFTELHQQGDLLFLTGADGPCHWSMSAQSGECCKTILDLSKPDTGLFDFSERLGLNRPPRDVVITRESQFLFFDIACRVKEAVGDLHSEYLAAGELECGVGEGENAKSGLLLIPEGILHVGCNPTQGEVVFRPEPKCVVTRIGSQLSFLSPYLLAETFPATARWSYAVGLVD